jgi:hypothetical protein
MLLFHIVMAIVSGLLSMGWIAIIIYLVKKLGAPLLGITTAALVALLGTAHASGIMGCF